MADRIGGYGVLVDLHRPRQDGGVPCLWDGWYQDRALALEALRLVEELAATHLPLEKFLTPRNDLKNYCRLNAKHLFLLGKINHFDLDLIIYQEGDIALGP